MKKLATYLLSFLYIVGSITGGFISAYAEETPQDLTGFSYKVILPENQHNPEVGYFDLRMTPGQQQTVQMQLNNSSEKEITVLVYLNGAKTNSNGVVEYGPNDIEKDASLKYDFEEIVTAAEEVVLAPKSEQMLDINIAMPEASFEGYISGAVSLEEKDAEGQDTESATGMIKNKFMYQTGILLSESDSEQIQPEMQLNKVYPELNNFRNAIFIDFSNIQPVYADGMTVDVQIMGKDTDEVLYDSKKSNMRMAPNTKIQFPVTMNGEQMQAGDYRANIVVTTEGGGRWQWEQEFTITDEEAEKFNEQDLSLVQEAGVNWMLIAMVVGGVLLLVLIIFLIVRAVQKNKKKKKKKGASSKGKKKK